MSKARYPTLEEFWQRLKVRGLEPDLVQSLRSRTRREDEGIHRLPADTTVAVISRLLPGTIPPEAIGAFLDANFDRQLGRADDKHGLMARDQLIPAGFAVLDDTARSLHSRPFAELEPQMQDELLAQAEKGALVGPPGFDSSTWFRRTRALVLLGLGSDPRGMVFMGYPGPSYKPGHIWLDEGEVSARAARKKGYLQL